MWFSGFNKSLYVLRMIHRANTGSKHRKIYFRIQENWMRENSSLWPSKKSTFNLKDGKQVKISLLQK